MTDRPLSLKEQADLIRSLTYRTVMREGEIAGEAHMTLTAKDARDLDMLAIRLDRMAPFEDQIRRMVTGR